MRINAILTAATQHVNKPKRVRNGGGEAESRSDSVQISAEARNLQRTKATESVPAGNPQIEKIAAIKAKVADGFYSTRQILNAVADKFLEGFGI